MAQETGTVLAVSSKQLQSGTYYSFNVNDVWYRTGKKRAPVEKGYKVRFNYTEDKYGKQVDLTSVQFKEGEAPKSTGKSYNAGGAGKDSYWADKEKRDVDTQKRISYQAAMNTAINVVNGAISNEYLKIPGGKKATLEAYFAAIKEQAAELYRDYQNVPENHESLMDTGEETKPKEDDMSDFADSTDQAEDLPAEDEEW